MSDSKNTSDVMVDVKVVLSKYQCEHLCHIIPSSVFISRPHSSLSTHVLNYTLEMQM